jgi:hypothetical protein
MPAMHRRILPLLLVLPLLAACQGPGYRGLWQPKPAEALITGEAGAPAARLSTAVLGEWRGEPSDGELHVRFLIENIGSSPVRIPLERIEMLTGDLQPCSAPRLVGGEELEVPPGSTGTFDVGFMPPAEDPDLSGLQLHWITLLDGREIPGAANFQYAEPAYGYGYPVYVGVGWGFHSDWCWNGGGSVPSSPVQALPPHTTSIPNH